jgi:hypothetical protein
MSEYATKIVTQQDIEHTAAIRAAYVRGVADGALILARTLPSDPTQLIDYKQGRVSLLLAIENVTPSEVKEAAPLVWEMIGKERGWA